MNNQSNRYLEENLLEKVDSTEIDLELETESEVELNEDDKKLIDASFSIQRKFISLYRAMDKKVSKENLENTIVQIFNILEFNNG